MYSKHKLTVNLIPDFYFKDVIFIFVISGGARGVLITSSRRTSSRLTSHETNIYVFTLVKNRGRTKCPKRYGSPIFVKQSASIVFK